MRAAICDACLAVAGSLRDQDDGAARQAATRRFAEGWDEIRRALQSPFWTRSGDESVSEEAYHMHLEPAEDGWALRVFIRD